ncbi:MAG TPA: succinate dehydrogenase cytochrome b subunit [Candidatus Limnocylindria bacterium]|jgi:succinate dehydrogenase / fumarate reductase cytochrome b subunit|nr:succinate dehydrogenase cytochrome b subunit [Candidatus Limnocylindria bacterium]
MNLLQRIWLSSLGKKYVMALSGAAMFAFLIGHLLGNLQVFGPPELINKYAHFLKSEPLLLWGARLGLLTCLGLHVASALALSAANKAARPERYAGGNAYGATKTSQYMLVTGAVIFAFVVYHLAHFTVLLPGINGVGDFRSLKTELHGEQVADVYATMILGFQVWWVSLFYLIAQAMLFFHLSHGVAAMFQSVGLRNHVWWPRIQVFARVASIVLFLGFASIPISVLVFRHGADYAKKAKAQVTLTSVVDAGKEVAR